MNPNPLFFAKDYTSNISRYAMRPLEHGDVQWMAFTGPRCTHSSEKDFINVTKKLEKQLDSKWCDWCHIFRDRSF